MKDIQKKFFEHIKEMSPTAGLISQYEVGDVQGERTKQHTDKTWSGMIMTAVKSGTKTKKEYEEYLRPFEMEILQKKWDLGDKSVRKDGKDTGKWLISRVSVKADGKSRCTTYAAAKSSIGKALDAGVPLLDANGNPKSKTKGLEKDTRTKTSKVTTTFDKAKKHAENLIKLWPELNDKEQFDIQVLIGKNGI